MELTPISSGTQKATPQKIAQENKPSTDFKELLLQSNTDIQEKRKKQKSGDLSSAENYEDFLDQIQSDTKNQNLPRNKLDKDDFLKLFITQLQQQDPLKPKDGTEMASQLAQFNSLEQMINVNTTLGRLEEATKAQNQKSFVDYLGKEAAISTGKSIIKDGKISEHSISFDTSVPESYLDVTDESTGEMVVSQKPLGAFAKGKTPFVWDGKNSKGEPLKEGNYRLTIKGALSGDQKVDGQILTHGKVLGIDLKSQTPLSTSMGALSINDLAELRDPGDNKP
jgi:flagellar basal-body rod modification protein FlgD